MSDTFLYQEIYEYSIMEYHIIKSKNGIHYKNDYNCLK